MATKNPTIKPASPAATIKGELRDLLAWLPIIAGLIVLYVPGLIDRLVHAHLVLYRIFRQIVRTVSALSAMKREEIAAFLRRTMEELDDLGHGVQIP